MRRLAFRFRYRHTNPLFVRLLRAVQRRASLPLALHRVGDDYVIEASAEQHALEKLAELVTSMVPTSLFLEHYGIEGLRSPLPESPLNGEPGEYEIPCCPECHRRIEERLEPIEGCDVCGFVGKEVGLEAIRTFSAVGEESGAAVFAALARRLIEEGELSLPTPNGLRRFGLLKGRSWGGVTGIVIGDPLALEPCWNVSMGERDALMTIEKPSVRLKPKLRCRAEYGLEQPFYPVFFPDDPITAALCAALKRQGIGALRCDLPPALRVVSAPDGGSVIIAPGRDILPWRRPLPMPKGCAVFAGYTAVGGPEGITLGTDIACGERPMIPAEEVPSAAGGMIYEPAHAALRSVAFENALGDRPLCGVYLSRTHRSQICAFTSRIGYLPLVRFGELECRSPASVLAAIAAADEAGKRLVGNFRSAFPERAEIAENAVFDGWEEASSLTRLWTTAALFLGLCDGGDVHEGCARLEAAALECNAKSGPRIDYASHAGTGARFDPVRAIRSAMSFRLAGVDPYLLAFGFIDSLADFISAEVEQADANVGIEGVTLAGDVFENAQLFARLHRSLSVNYRVDRNRTLPMDGANVALGALWLGRE